MSCLITTPLRIGNLTIPHRLIQGPLAGYSCAPFRELFQQFVAPAYTVTEMCSAIDIQKHNLSSRYLYRSPQEKILAYQISGNNEKVLADAAVYLQDLGADLIDINCGCPKNKIRKKGAGSALLENPDGLIHIVKKVRSVLSIPLTVKIRIQDTQQDLDLSRRLEDAGADALVVHGRRWTEDYDIPCNTARIAEIKSNITIPVIANGDIHDRPSLDRAVALTGCDAFMIARAGSGRPWLYQELLDQVDLKISLEEKKELFLIHLQGLADLENEHQAVLQSKSLIRYYFRSEFTGEQFAEFYSLVSLAGIRAFLQLA